MSMTTTIDEAGRVVIPAEVRKRLGLTAGTELEVIIEGSALRLVRAVAGPQLVRRGERLVARPQAPEGQRAEINVPRLIEEERDLAETLIAIGRRCSSLPDLDTREADEILGYDETGVF